MHRMRASVVQVVHVFRATPKEQTAPLLAEFDAKKKECINRLLPTAVRLGREFEATSPPSLSSNHRSTDTTAASGNLPAKVIAIPAYVGSTIDTAHAVAQIPLSPQGPAVSARHDGAPSFPPPTESELVQSLLQNPQGSPA